MKKPYAKLDKGSLLIASPDMETSMFSRSVILLCEHGISGSFGLILNKPLSAEVAEDFVFSDKIVNPKVHFYMGGPLHAHQMMMLHSCSEHKDHIVEICPSVYLGGDLSFFQEMITAESGPEIHLYLGHCSWAAGQLEREFLDGLWILSAGKNEDVFFEQPEVLWAQTLLDLGGKYASWSTVPENLFLN